VPADPLVGVVIPAHDAERYLGEALESVVDQEHCRVDVVVVDDGSTDGTAAVAERFGPPVRVVRQANAGIGAARNRGVAEVRGELLLFLDADDLIASAGLARVELLDRQPELDMVFGQVSHFAEIEAGAPVPLWPRQPAHIPNSMLIRRTAFERVGDFAAGLRVSEGLDWLLRARERGLREATVEDVVLWRRVHGQNNSLRHRAEIGEFAHALKASLDRRRAAG
jgi:glycosyltransferase involved in cell wall biosynthesis